MKYIKIYQSAPALPSLFWHSRNQPSTSTRYQKYNEIHQNKHAMPSLFWPSWNTPANRCSVIVSTIPSQSLVSKGFNDKDWALLYFEQLLWPSLNTFIPFYNPRCPGGVCTILHSLVQPSWNAPVAQICPDNRGHWGFNSSSSLTHLFSRHHPRNLDSSKTELEWDQIIYWLLYTLV